jgi:c-di-GMP-binding flagellar brake protein YcgR
MDEKRRPPRIETDLRFISCSSGISLDSRIANISATGALIETSEPLPIDAELDLHLQLPDDPEIISIDARVVWTKAMSCAALAGMGIQFKNILPKHQEKLADFIAYNLQSDNGSRHGTLYV